MFFSATEEIGYGGATIANHDVDELIAVDIGCVDEHLKSSEKRVSICAKDSGGPYSYESTSALINVAQRKEIDYAIDIYPFYKSDAEVALRAGINARHALCITRI